MKYNRETHVLTLSRRNILALLAKLEVNRESPGESACTLLGGTEADFMLVVAQEDDDHYTDRPAGMMHPREELHLTKPATGITPY